MCCFRGLREGIRLSTIPSNIDIIARTRNRRCVHRNPERHIYGQLSDNTSAQRECENQDQERSKTGDTISPKLFTTTLESIFRRLNWENKGVKIDGEFLSPRVSPLGDHMTRKDDKGDQPSGGETT